MIKQFVLTPPPRVDDLNPFVSLKIRESATSSGTFTLIDTQAWSDATPSTVTATAVETTEATLEDGWYQFQWADGNGDVTQWFGPLHSGPDDGVFSVQEARDALGDQAYSESKILDAREFAQDELERALGFSLVPRTVTEQVTTRSGYLRLRPHARDMTAVTVDGDALTLADLTLDLDGVVTGYGWPDRDPVTVSYTHGLATVPPGAKRAALALAVDYLRAQDGTGTIDPRAESVVTVDGTIRLRGGGVFANPVADEWVRANRVV